MVKVWCVISDGDQSRLTHLPLYYCCFFFLFSFYAYFTHMWSSVGGRFITNFKFDIWHMTNNWPEYTIAFNNYIQNHYLWKSKFKIHKTKVKVNQLLNFEQLFKRWSKPYVHWTDFWRRYHIISHHIISHHIMSINVMLCNAR